MRRTCCALMLCLLAARASATGAPDDIVVWNPNREDKAALDRIATEYNARRGGAQPRVVIQHYAFDGFSDRISGTVPRGKGPDVFIYPQDRLGGWIEAGNTVEPIDRYLDAPIRGRFIPTTMQAMVFRDVTYGLPLGFKTLALIYNKKLVSEPPKTTEELAVFAKKLTDRAAERYGFVYRYDNYYFHAALQNGFGGGVFTPQLVPTLDCLENVQAMHLLLRWKADLLPENAPTRERLASLFNQGKAAIVFDGPWFTKTDVAKGISYGVAQLPTISEAGGRPMRPWMTVDGLYISPQSKQKLAAFEFLSYLTDVAAETIIGLEGTDAPANQRVYLDAAILADEVLATSFKQARVAVPMPNVPEMTAMWTPATTALGTIVRGTATPEDALAKAQAQVALGVAALQNPRPPPPK